jgi:Domain of unknown function (DUF4276)
LVTEIRIYFEGDKALRPGFRQFLSEVGDIARMKRIRFQPVAVGGRPEEDFHIALKSHPDAWNVLLRDSEGPNPPRRVSVFWMVQIMEAWFLADPEALERYYGAGFVNNALKKNPRVEGILKVDVLESLKQATKKTQKGVYHKTAHAPEILALLDPHKVREAAPNCARLFRELLAKLDE